jgi:hypothetical protein
MLCTESQRRQEVNAMALRQSNYDGDLQMFIDTPREPDMARLTFLRWLVEQRHFEYGPAGAPSGDFATRPGLSGEHIGVRKAA